MREVDGVARDINRGGGGGVGVDERVGDGPRDVLGASGPWPASTPDTVVDVKLTRRQCVRFTRHRFECVAVVRYADTSDLQLDDPRRCVATVRVRFAGRRSWRIVTRVYDVECEFTAGAATARQLAAKRPAWGLTAAPIRECGNYPRQQVGAGVYNITSRVTRCRTARRMARRFWHGRWRNVPRTDRPNSDRPFRRGSYTCRNRHLGIELNDMHCTASGGRVVRWQWGA
jgi:hypothetical protein